MEAYLNRVVSAVPSTPCHALFQDFARRLIDGRERVLLERMLRRSGIDERYSVLMADTGGDDCLDKEGFYRYGHFPSTARRMQRYSEAVMPLALPAVKDLGGDALDGVTHLLFCTCTGFTAPGLDLALVKALGLDGGVKRTVIGFMGCYAGVTALRNASEIVKGDQKARVLIVSVELCTLHLQETDDLETVLSFSLFGDGVAAAIVSAKPEGFRLDNFRTVLLQHTEDLITWDIGDQGFDMVLSGGVPQTLKEAMPTVKQEVVPDADDISLWAVHPGGKTILDAAETGLELPPEALTYSRDILSAYGNMSSATVLFVLSAMLENSQEPGALGAGMAFGPGLTAETFRFTAC